MNYRPMSGPKRRREASFKKMRLSHIFAGSRVRIRNDLIFTFLR